MPSPFDYTLSGADPMLSLQQGMGFNQQQRQGEQDLLAGQQAIDLNASQEARNATQFGQQNTLFDQGQQDRQAMMAAQEAERQKALAMQTDLVGLSEIVRGGGATANDFAAIAVKYPDLAEEMSKTWEGQTQERKAADMGNIYKAAAAIKSGAPQIAVDMLEERAAAAEAAGDKMEADVSRAMAATIQADPSAGLTTLGLLMHSVDPKAAIELFGEGAKRTVQSTQPYDNGTTVTVFNDGSKEVTDAAGAKLEGQAAIDAITAAQENEASARGANAAAVTGGKLETEIAMGGEAEAAKEAGKQAIAKSGEAYDALSKVNSNITTIDTAIAAIDDGANSGAIARYFPNITSASAGLENAMNRLGLDVIGSVTFGALSEWEMRLAMETAVPRNLDEPALKAWLVKKKAAQEKASDALYEAAVYLGKPGNTLSKWMEEKRGGNTPAPSADAATPSADGLSDDDLKYLGAR